MLFKASNVLRLLCQLAALRVAELQPRAKDGSPISTVWRGVREDRSRLPDDFWMATDKNQGTPGGAEMAFMSTTADPTIAHTYSVRTPPMRPRHRTIRPGTQRKLFRHCPPGMCLLRSCRTRPAQCGSAPCRGCTP